MIPKIYQIIRNTVVAPIYMEFGDDSNFDHFNLPNEVWLDMYLVGYIVGISKFMMDELNGGQPLPDEERGFMVYKLFEALAGKETAQSIVQKLIDAQTVQNEPFNDGLDVGVIMSLAMVNGLNVDDVLKEKNREWLVNALKFASATENDAMDEAKKARNLATAIFMMTIMKYIRANYFLETEFE